MTSYPDSHVFSQGGDLSQLTGGFTSQNDSGIYEDELGQRDTDLVEQDGAMSSRAEAICKENRKINRFVELNLKQLEMKRIKLMKEDKELEAEKTKLLEIQKRQSDQSIKLQMDEEECSLTYMNVLKERNKVVEKLKQVEDFINVYEQNVVKGKTLGESIEESKQWLESEFDQIKKKSKAVQDKITRSKVSCLAMLEEKAKKCKELKDVMVKDREDMVSEIQSLAFKNEEMLVKCKDIQEEIEKMKQNKIHLIESYNSTLKEYKQLNEGVSMIYQELNESKKVNASRIQQLKLKINTEENINCNLKIRLEKKKDSMHGLTSKRNELTNLSKQLKETVDEAEKRVEKKVREIKMYKDKKPVLSDQARTLRETLKRYENVETENEHYKKSILYLEEDIKLNISKLTEKENNVCELKKEMKALEDKLSILKENNSDVEKKIENLNLTKRNILVRVEENKVLCKQERESKLKENETLKQINENLSAEIEQLTLKLTELHSFNENSQVKEEEIKQLIKSCKEAVRINEDKLLKSKEDQIKTNEEYKRTIDEMKSYMEKHDFLIIEGKPMQEELMETLEKKQCLEQSIKLLDESHNQTINNMKNSHMAKMQEMDSEMEKHTSIMKDIQKGQEESTNKLKEELKVEEKVKTDYENELRGLKKQLKTLKNEELMKRSKIAKMEKRQQAIIQEINVTREDIAQAVAGKSQDSTRRWVESVPQDEFEFSEV
ncbi:myosin heavy chain, clone 203-like [Macrosteles quadrilineatus]|uniref:myosin heavy chain, clone 203-like n=1 Tax=Macrosteles quadrilineatus TaxID=74068 RepID=UPI0023E21DC9|nr:myosin heavy chain, clone 203-like [Macrosteles quadrilineatus]